MIHSRNALSPMKADTAWVAKEHDPEAQSVAVVILNWNSGNEIVSCLDSVFESTHRKLTVVVVDNGSSDGSSDVIRLRYPQVQFISNPVNLGFAKGSNQGMEWAMSHGVRYVLLLNADARLHPVAIRELLSAADGENTNVVACPRMYRESSNGGLARLWFACGSVKLWAGLFANPAFNQVDSPQWSVPRDMQFASGCCMLIPARALEDIGMLDERFFAYCEDIDWSIRARKAGYRLRYVPTASLWHGSSESPIKRSATIYRYLSTRNNIWTVRKHGSWFEIFSCLSILPFRSLLRIGRLIPDAQWDVIGAELKGLRDGLLSNLNPHSHTSAL